MTRYKLVFGVTLPSLELEINQMVQNESSARLINAFYAQGSGFVGAMVYEGEAATTEATPAVKKNALTAARKNKVRPS